MSIDITNITFSPDGKTLAVLGDDVKLWDTSNGQLLRTITGSDHAMSVAFSIDGRMLATGQDDNTIKIWDSASGQLLRTLIGHNGWVDAVAFSPNGQILASGAWDGNVRTM